MSPSIPKVIVALVSFAPSPRSWSGRIAVTATILARNDVFSSGT